jgi:hypothetical protein
MHILAYRVDHICGNVSPGQWLECGIIGLGIKQLLGILCNLILRD